MEILAVTNVDYNTQKDWEYEVYPTLEEGECTTAVTGLSKRLETEFRAAKLTHMSCGKVLLPCGLFQAISRDILAMADSKPCGFSGCMLYLNFAGEQDCRIKCSPYTDFTFKLYLFNSFLPQFLKKTTYGDTVMISTEYDLDKKNCIVCTSSEQ
ncbi:hypothetical protein RN001_004567 [Aquatica leii]|uniref:Uncharacterized protein n=1 Tax=Aquatica leii TaxID=1421715 RepID=A0AAN7SPK7_9COLE|nr:hypothetical protein RN001_004567 [Aquatica leii]